MSRRLHLVLSRLWRRLREGSDEVRTARARTHFWAEVREGQCEADAFAAETGPGECEVENS